MPDDARPALAEGRRARRGDSPVPLPSGETARALRLVMLDGLTSQTMATLTTGVFQVGLALELGASNLAIGILAALPFLTQLLQLPAISLVERLQVRRPISAIASALGRSFLALTALTPLLGQGWLPVGVLIACVAAQGGLGALSNCAWNSWMRDLVPQERFGAFFGRRLFYMAIAGVIVSLAAGAAIDAWRSWSAGPPGYAYTLLFLAGALAGLLGAAVLWRTPEPRMAAIEGESRLSARLREPFQDLNFRRVILFLASWGFATNLAAPFFTVYMLKSIELPMSLVIGVTVLNQLVNLTFYRIWGGIADRLSNRAVLDVCAPLFLACILGWTFLTFPERHVLTVPLLVLLHALMGVATAGVTLSSGNIVLKLSPRGRATAYLAANSIVVSLAAGVASVLGGAFADAFAQHQLTMSFEWTGPGQDIVVQTLKLRHWDFFFFTAFVVGLYSLHRLGRISEDGAPRDRAMIVELLSETRRLFAGSSSAAGLARIGIFPFAALRFGRNGSSGRPVPGRSPRE
jgi:MFS family permease